MNDPFSNDAREELLNFATGAVLPTDISDNLLSSTEKGREQMDTFVEKRLSKCEVLFWDPLLNLKIKTFSCTTKKTQVKVSNDKFATVRADRDLFGRLLIASNARQIDLKEVLSYELSTVQFALAHQDGSLRKTIKSVFAKILEDQMHVVPRLPPSTALKAVYIIDGMALVQMMKSAGASTFGELACKCYASITAPLSRSICSEVHVLFDQYWESSIKGGERTRSSSSLEVHMHGPSTSIPKKWAKYIANPPKKGQPVRFCYNNDVQPRQGEYGNWQEIHHRGRSQGH